MEVRILKKKAPLDTPDGLRRRLAADLERILPADAFAFALPDGEDAAGPRKGLPAIVIIHRGRALGLELTTRESLTRQVAEIFRTAGRRG